MPWAASYAALDAPACAVELIHAYSLVHDDLPAMDDDDLRRGRPTCHVAYGEAMAILAGDALQALAFELLAGDARMGVDDATRVRMLRTLGTACGAQGMAGGQAVDLAGHRHAAGRGRAGTHACAEDRRADPRHRCTWARWRAVARDAATLEALDRYAHAVGLAFQVRDDILDVEADTGCWARPPARTRRRTNPPSRPCWAWTHRASACATLIDEALSRPSPSSANRPPCWAHWRASAAERAH